MTGVWWAPDIAVGVMGAVELAIPALAIYGFLRRQGHTLAEAAAYGLGLPLMALSGIYQVAALAARSHWAWGLELVFLLGSGAALWRQGIPLRRLGRELIRFSHGHLPAVLSLALGGLWLGIHALRAPVPGSGAALLLGRTFPEMAAAGLMPGNAQWVGLFPMGFGFSGASGLPTLGAYGAIGFATYALARRYAWPPTAITATLVVLSMPRLAALAPSGRPEIITSSIALLGLLAVFRMVERPYARDGVVLAWAVAFTIGGPAPRLPLVLPSVLALLVLVFILRRYDYRTFLPALKAHPFHLLLAILPLIVFTQIPALWFGLPWIDTPPNRDGLQGSVANLARYLLECGQLPRPLETISLALWDYSPRQWLEQVHQQWMAVLADICPAPCGTPSAFRIVWSPRLPWAWFGPLSLLLILPAMGYALIRAPRRLKALVVALGGYLFLITLIPAWQPGNGYFFTPFFTLGGFCTAFFLPPWRFTRRRRTMLQLVCAGLLGYVCLAHNTPLPVPMIYP